MSTRCHIAFYSSKNQRIYEPDALLYRHSDGYPDTENGVLATLVPFCEMFQKRRGLSDTEYAAAWCLHDQIEHHVKWATEFAAEHESTHMPDDGIDCLGFGICKGFHGDIEFLYRVNPKSEKEPAQIIVYEVNLWNDIPEYKEVDRINLCVKRKVKSCAK